jgi:hypothetical protein
VWVGVLLVYMSLTGPPLHPSVGFNTSCRHRYKGSATAFLRNMFSSLAVERGPKRCGHIKEAERRQRNRRHVPQNALVFGGAREHRYSLDVMATCSSIGPIPEPACRQLGLREYFETLPARSTVKVAELLMGARAEIEAVAVRRFCL